MKIKIVLKNWRYIFYIFPFCQIYLMNYSGNSTVYFLYELLKIAAVLMFGIHVVKNGFVKSRIALLAFGYEICYLVPAILRDNITGRTMYLWIKETYTAVFSILIISMLLKENYRRTISIMYYILASWCILHVVVASVSSIMVLGIRTRFGDTFIIAMTLFLVKRALYKMKINFFDLLFWLLGVFYIFKEKISTMIVLIIVVIFVEVFVNMNFFQKIFDYYIMTISAIVFNFLLVVGKIQYLFSWLLVDILHEDLSLDGRTYIWNVYLNDMLSNDFPLLGQGIIGENLRFIDKPIPTDTFILSPRQAHNQLVSVLYWTGIGGLFCYVMAILAAGVFVKKCENKKVVQYFTLGIFMICLSMVTELSGDTHLFWMYLVFLYSVSMREGVEENE